MVEYHIHHRDKPGGVFGNGSRDMSRKTLLVVLWVVSLGCGLSVRATLAAESKPNVILIMTDDQGYGDVSAHGNPVLKTPELDKLWKQSVRFTDFHVAPKCTPTRGQLLTGVDAMRNGATRVCQGRSMVRAEFRMMPEFFVDAGYATGLFGKWHLGDSYPHRPRFRGFQEVVSFRAWGITSLADYWMNTYFDPVLMHNGVDKKYKGYCTDIFFREAMAWIKRCKAAGKPFFAYIPTNTPHVPNVVDDSYSTPYVGKHGGKKIPDKFYGMIANIDENIGKLEAFLKAEGLRDNTILIFLSDNGTQSGSAKEIFNAGMRDRKGSVVDGGHRVPLFVRWIDGRLQHGNDIGELAVVQDLLPTLMDLCGLQGDRSGQDGVSLAGLLTGKTEKLPERTCVTQIGFCCDKWDQAVVMKDKWRLIRGKELYNIATDPHQDRNVCARFPEVTAALNAHYDRWYAGARAEWEQTRYITVGSEAANPVILYASDWQGDYCDNRGGLIGARGKGYWDLVVERDGAYEVELRRWPKESGKALVEPFENRDWAKKSARPIAKAQLIVADFDRTVDTLPADQFVNFTVNLKAGKTRLTANLLDASGKILCGAMYVHVNRVGPAGEGGQPSDAGQVERGGKSDPNVLFIAIDDMNDWTTVFDKNNPIKTPNLERLAERGTFFENAYCAAPACAPSRAAIMTGRAPHRSGVLTNGDAWSVRLPDAVVIPRYFMANGYQTRTCGKIFHHGGSGRDPKDKPSFQQKGKWHLHAGRPPRNYNGYTRRPLSSPAFDWGEHNVNKHNDEYTVEWGADIMKREWKAGMQPQFLALGIFRPHLPFWAPTRSFKDYPGNEDLVQPHMPDGDLGDVSPVGVELTLKERFFQDNLQKQEDFSAGSDEQLVRCYQAASTFADEMVGCILDRLDATEQADNTIIVLWSDHGYHLGDKECYVKFTLWEKANHVPFIIVAPGVTKPGTRCKAPVSLLDIYPTLVDLAGLPTNPKNDGVSLKPLLENVGAEWDRPALMTYRKGNHAIKTADYRYIRYHDGSEELYTHADSWNVTNLADQPDMVPVLKKHRRLLDEAVGSEDQRAAANGTELIPAREDARPPERPGTMTNGGRTSPRAADETSESVPFRTAPVAPVVAPAPVSSALLFPNSDFETGTLENWTAEGDAFTVQPTKGDNPTARRRRDASAHQGGYWIGTFEKYDGKTGRPGQTRGDKPTGSLTSIPFVVKKTFITFRVGGGAHAGRTGVSLLHDGKATVMGSGFNSETMKQVSFDASRFVGKQVQLVVHDKATGHWGHINVDDFRATDKPAKKVAKTSPPATSDEPVNYANFNTYLDVGYDQPLRPQFHFTSRKNWLNDPNGMVYYDGEWHMYFQHVAIANNTGPKSWGNAKSTDLMHWVQYPHAVNPYPNVFGKEGHHTVWSGSAVVDVLDALGKQQGDTKTLFALFTATNPDGFFQGGAYSTDKGRTWTKVNGGKPVIPHQKGFSRGQRDPRIFYYAPGKCYYTIMMIGGPERKVRLWKSTNLLDWEQAFDIPNKAAECIDMYEAAVDGDSANARWVIANAGTGYEVGEFDGKSWKGHGNQDANGKPLRFDYGDSYYAAQVFNQAPGGRIVHVGWLRCKAAGYRPFLEAGMPFTQQMSVPAEITLRTTPDGIRMYRNPVKEIETLYRASHRFEGLDVQALNAKLRGVQPELVDLTLAFEPKGDLVLSVRGLKIAYVAESHEIVFENPKRVEGIRRAWKKDQPFRDNGIRKIPAPLVAGKVTLRALVDRASLELFVNNGQAAASFVVVPDPANRTITVAGGAKVTFESVEVNELTSAWNE
jgi:arylsulfatase A-like enzyme/sucrose-6-phosphate hydrolase SacC (GH32 family)